MTEIVGIRFRGAGKTYYFDPCGAQYEEGAKLVVETAAGTELGECVASNRMVADEKIVPPFRKVMRRANADDLAKAAAREQEELAARNFCQDCADARNLDMRVISAERSLDGSKMVFSFVSENRVDFRELVRDLVAQHHTRVELRQVGVRDKAKMLGGLGICGRPFCCSQFLREFHPVSIKMAKDQSLSLSPTKISGTCGRLMCCLKYEQEAYSELLKTTPKLGSLVRTVDGEGTVTAINLLRRQLRVLLENGDEFSAKYYHIDDIEVLRNGKARLGQAGQRPAGQSDKPRAPKSDAQSHEDGEQAQKERRPRPQRKPSADAPQGEQTERPEGEQKPRRRRGGRGRGGSNREGQQPSQE